MPVILNYNGAPDRYASVQLIKDGHTSEEIQAIMKVIMPHMRTDGVIGSVLSVHSMSKDQYIEFAEKIKNKMAADPATSPIGIEVKGLDAMHFAKNTLVATESLKGNILSIIDDLSQFINTTRAQFPSLDSPSR